MTSSIKDRATDSKINTPQTKALQDPTVISLKNQNKSNTGWNSKSDTKSQRASP